MVRKEIEVLQKRSQSDEKVTKLIARFKEAFKDGKGTVEESKFPKSEVADAARSIDDIISKLTTLNKGAQEDLEMMTASIGREADKAHVLLDAIKEMHGNLEK